MSSVMGHELDGFRGQSFQGHADHTSGTESTSIQSQLKSGLSHQGRLITISNGPSKKTRGTTLSGEITVQSKRCD